MFGKLNEARKMAEAVKEKLENTMIEGRSADGHVLVVCNGNRRVISVSITGQHADNAALAINFQMAVNEALEKAEKMAEEEMRNAANALMPGGLGALGSMFGK